MEIMVEYATTTINVDSRGMPRLLIKKNIADAMHLKELSKKGEKLMAVYDEKKKILQVMPMKEFEKRAKF